MQAEQFAVLFPAANIILPCIKMITRQNFDFLQQFFWSQKLPHPPKTKSHGMRMQYFPTLNILLGTLNGRL